MRQRGISECIAAGAETIEYVKIQQGSVTGDNVVLLAVCYRGCFAEYSKQYGPLWGLYLTFAAAWQCSRVLRHFSMRPSA